VEQAQTIAGDAAETQSFSGAELDRPSMRFRILGPLQMISAGDGSGSMAGMGQRERTLLAVLLLRANEYVSKQHLADTLWPDNPPAKVDDVIVAYISRLRRKLHMGLFDDCSLAWITNGYRLQIAPGILDLQVFEGAIEDARKARREGNLDTAAATLKRGLGLWLGEQPLADVQGGEFIKTSRQQLAERRITAIKELLTLQIELGEYRDVADVLTGLVSSHPFDEELLSLRMAALHGSGRTADALVVYRDFRRTLANELGIEPSPRSQLVQQKILRGDPDILESGQPIEWVPQRTVMLDGSAVTRRPAELPAAAPRLYGRSLEFRALDKLAKSGSEVAIITGMPGVGKTALAVRWAQAHRQDFPDGQLYVNLARDGSDEERDNSRSALLRMLSSLGVPSSRIPPDAQEQAALYRTLLADRKMLVILDDAQSTDQILPLLPGSPMCMTVITARNRLTEAAVRIGAATLIVAPLDQQNGIALLAETVGSDRVETEPGKAVELVQLCGGLPLALQVAGGLLRARPTWSLAMLADSLADRQLDFLYSGNLNMRSIIEAVYRGLPHEAAWLLQLLATHPAESIDANTAAEISRMSPAATEANLSILLESHMISEVSPGSYQCHELLRAFARQLGEVQQAATPSELTEQRPSAASSGISGHSMPSEQI
jgi:DNA-binding SARP family transcriptional activator